MTAPADDIDGRDTTSLARLWSRLRTPADVAGALEALVGLPSRTARQLVSASVAGSRQASELLEAMPLLLRRLSISSVAVPERSFGETRGPVLWAETVAARSASAGDPNLFVCTRPSRGYDTAENRILTHALGLVVRGGRELDRLHLPGREEPPLFAAARHNALTARRFLDHPALVDLRQDRVPGRALARLAHDPRRRSYRPVIEMLRIAADPVRPATIQPLCDEATLAEYDLVVATIQHLERRGVHVPPFLVVDHALLAGPVRYRCSGVAGPGAPGLTVAGTRLALASTLPDPDGVTVIAGRGDLAAAIDALVERGSV